MPVLHISQPSQHNPPATPLMRLRDPVILNLQLTGIQCDLASYPLNNPAEFIVVPKRVTTWAIHDACGH
jgi:hypothetical protein